jgi:cell division protein FtsW
MIAAAAQALKPWQAEALPASDRWLLGAVTMLLALGLVMVYSATVAGGAQSLDTNFHHLHQHAMHILLGLVLAGCAVWTRPSWWERSSKPLLAVALLLLVVLLLPGIGLTVNGSTRWLAVGPIRMQPAEVAKLCMVIYAAGYLTRKRESLGDFTQGVLIIGIVLAALALLLLLQPDFGSSVVITVTVGAMLFLGGIRFWHFLLCLLVGITATVVLAYIEPYRWARVTSFLNPWSDPYDSGFQLTQALIAFGRGEWLGVGLGESIQKLYYLPHANNDFLLAVIAEELGVAGVLAVIGLFGIVLWRAFAIARRAELAGKVYAARLAQGLGLLLIFQAIVNMGVNMGVLPTKGLTLPFMSYGGSSMLSSCVAVGLLLMVDRDSRRRPGSGP